MRKPKRFTYFFMFMGWLSYSVIPVMFRSPVPITKGRWHRARASRSGRHGSLQLDHHPTQRGHSSPPLTHLELTLPLFIGSLP